ncbi:guanylin-like [Labrus mixtus]|uniref:guanylin-like n=1 Tax=Labrus mixtus TaxID=508554 RepID=UPI0029C00B77|nr:guanylin-like [Labrus mixtus]
MKTLVCVSVFVTVLFQTSCTVTVTEGDFHFSLEAVKALGALMSAEEDSSKQEVKQVEVETAAVCSHPDLPEDFKPLCLREDAGAALARLAAIASDVDPCEICESVACTGC